jgi:hypothetical protein
LVKWDAPKTFLDNIKLPWAGKVWEHKEASDDKGPERKFASLEGYERKAKERSGIILGYLKYDEKKISLPEDADVFLGQAELKIGKDTAIILDGLYMDDWHMPRTSFGTGERLTVFRQTGITSTREDIVVPDLKTPYHLLGGYADTQLFGLQIYGAYYWRAILASRSTQYIGTLTELLLMLEPQVLLKKRIFQDTCGMQGLIRAI